MKLAILSDTHGLLRPEVLERLKDVDAILHGGDMSTEALVAKTMWALGQTDDPAELRRLFYQVVNYDRLPEE